MTNGSPNDLLWINDIYSPIIPIEKTIVPNKKILTEESIAIPNSNVVQNNILVIKTTSENMNPTKPKKIPLKVMNLKGFFDKVTNPNIPKSIKKGNDALLSPLFLFALL